MGYFTLNWVATLPDRKASFVAACHSTSIKVRDDTLGSATIVMYTAF